MHAFHEVLPSPEIHTNEHVSETAQVVEPSFRGHEGCYTARGSSSVCSREAPHARAETEAKRGPSCFPSMLLRAQPLLGRFAFCGIENAAG